MSSINPASSDPLGSKDCHSEDINSNISEIPVYSSASSQVVTEYGKQNMFATQVKPQLIENYSNYPEEAEKTNGRWAMIGIIALFGSYITTGQIIPGIF